MLAQALCRIIVWRPRRATRCGWKPRFIQRKCTEPRLHAEALLLLVGSYCFAAQVLVVASHTPPVWDSGWGKYTANRLVTIRDKSNLSCAYRLGAPNRHQK
jgi:hypothetical protein